jgi:hypothetical protein
LFLTTAEPKSVREEDYARMIRKRAARPTSDIAEETARILYLAYGLEAVHMAELRCAELNAAGDKRRLATWKKVLDHVRGLTTANPEEPATSH